ncbi:jg19553 [Pararge aegeria aegeria]|uniref:Jg19553 protein n=1 Tax=Pararge aegeria aegeria TaxID=348720 RepID=A0A8S4RAB3_9NEOP|nr:jg19553 [Pararge aegeria aegeria]
MMGIHIVTYSIAVNEVHEFWSKFARCELDAAEDIDLMRAQALPKCTQMIVQAFRRHATRTEVNTYSRRSVIDS